MRLDLIVGPNGAGKTTIAELVLSQTSLAAPFVNADVIAEQRWPGDTERHAYEAARIAERTRAALIEARLPFIAETVFSHESKLDLVRSAKTAGYTVALHVVLVPVEVSVARVRRRVDAGGHPVPEGKIRDRYERLWPLVRVAISPSDSASVWDNTTLDRQPRRVARFVQGVAVEGPDWPSWTPTGLTDSPGGSREVAVRDPQADM